MHLNDEFIQQRQNASNVQKIESVAWHLGLLLFHLNLKMEIVFH